MNTLRMTFSTVLLCGLMASVSGCGESGPHTIHVTGKVDLEGEPLDTGDITFMPLDGKGSAVTAKVTDGKYALDIVPGKKRVQIVSQKVSGQTPARPGEPDSPMIDQITSQVGLDYNVESSLEADVSESNRTFDFPVKKPIPGEKRRSTRTPNAH